MNNTAEQFRPGDRVQAYVEDWAGCYWVIATLIEYGEGVSTVLTDDGYERCVYHAPGTRRIRKVEEVFP